MHRDHDPRPRERGQILVLFALSFVALIAIAGLAVDGGSTFAQQRDEQSASDMAALAGANDYLINGSSTVAIATARSVAATNGYTHGSNGTVVAVTIDTSNGVAVTVRISSPHQNLMVSVMGFRTWTVTTDSTALAGFPDTAYGASPFIFSADAFGTDGTPTYQTPTSFGEGNSDIPTSALDFAWTNYGTGNVNTTDVDKIIKGLMVINKQIEFGEYIGQANQGNHSFLFDDVLTYLVGLDIPAAVVDRSGNFVGWASFHVTGAVGGSTKQITGYFNTAFQTSRLGVTGCEANACPRYLGSYVLKLTE